MGSTIGPLHAAVYTRATADSELSGLVTGVVQFVREGQPFPYVRIGAASETPHNTHDSFGANTSLMLHVFDRARNWDTVTTIANRLVTIFDHQALTIAGHRTVACRFEQTLTLPDPDPEIRHATVRFAINTQQE